MSAVQQKSADQRRAPRLRALMGAKILFNQGNSSLDCLIRDISEGGARLSASQAVTLPDEFELFIPQKNATFRVRMVWRRSEGVGVSFSEELEPEAKPSMEGDAGLRHRIRELEAEVTRLQVRIAQLTEG
jgi:hypothetical protein